MKKLSGRYYFIIYIFLFLLIISSPFWLWQIKPSETLDVLIFDKTVPNQTYQEHQGLTWVLNNNKYKKSDGTNYNQAEDYVGFHPLNNDQYRTSTLPEQMDSYDMIYLADSYGVYEEEFYGANETGARSELMYGGLQMAEVDMLEQALYENGTTLIAEFNTFASPTEPAVRERMYNLLNIEWNGWIGRYFPDLANSEVPNWVKGNLDAQGQAWNFQGPGFVFVSDNDFVHVVSEEGITEDGVLFQTTDEGEAFFGDKITTSYGYWFDVITANDKEEVLATYTLPLVEKEKEELQSLGISNQFPAIVKQQNARFSTYYFAGDYADQREVPGIYQSTGLDFIRQLQGNQTFYWDAYVPIMETILAQSSENTVEQETVNIAETNGIQTNMQTNGSHIQVLKDGEWRDLLIKGVNMGIAKPGAFPGETAITKNEYFRWFQQIGDMHANTIRVYTIHPPAFYEALYEYNQRAKEPLFIFHGLWVNEEDMLTTQDMFSSIIVDEVQAEIKRMIDVVHGNVVLPERPGHASGAYTKDVSPYVAGYIFGTEWDPYVVKNTNSKNEKIDQFKGEFVETTDASPFEVWLAQMLEYTAQYETAEYNWQHALSFTNWVTTDLLEHPYEPLEEEDLVSVNPNHIRTTDQFTSGMFASYHVYPYYPDFLNLNPDYQNYLDHKGEKNNYAGYLNDLRKAHDMPVLVAEFGVPASRGLTHRNVHGMDQGHNSETEQGKANAKLFESIVQEDYAGGLVFAWHDEWFKRTWNTMDYDNPDRRPYWSDYQTNEQHFGLLSFDPGTTESIIYVDGNSVDWERKAKEPLYQAENSNELIKNMYMDADQAYLYMRLDLSKPIDWDENDFYIALDSITGQGQTELSLTNGQQARFDFATDFKLELKSPEDARLLVDSYYDVFHYQYGHTLEMIPKEAYADQKDNGVFHPIRLALNKELIIPEVDISLPFESYETGELLIGNGNPNHSDFNSLTDISIGEDQRMIEIRIPWLLLNVKDPSLKEVMGDVWDGGLDSSQFIDGINIGVAATEDNAISHQFSSHYSWDTWNLPTYHERLKKSYYIMQDLYKNAEIVEE
ncbi:hypothetical protein GCM10011351_00820 [Paraliobacillus quinghaiensis]|uniref:Family 2 glycosyl transferase n=1 Tax=Paraliobacillus quinghaiensis TaxID=470815 RepID=A0A917TE09_9BACI|nr:hypothetical protein [Paraliobacillus quinghaiensis]GGM18863.1 hypothetical protein GCM10011351_00820 [Paraliobacillus quinghaiensis]